MRTNYHYIVVTIGDNKYFINKDMDYTDDFSNVLRFDSRKDALDSFIGAIFKRKMHRSSK